MRIQFRSLMQTKLGADDNGDGDDSEDADL